MQRLKVGLVGTAQLSFPGPKSEAYAASVSGMEKNAQEFGFELVTYRQIVITVEDASAAVAYFEEQKVDFLMIENVTFSMGRLTQIFAKIKNAKIGMWAIPEGESAGIVPFNSFCSLNMHMSILKRYMKDFRIPCKWFYGAADDAEFRTRLRLTVAALTALVNMKRARIGLIGGVAPGFDDLYIDERKLNGLFDGVYINRLHEFDEVARIADELPAAEAEAVAERMVNGVSVHPKARESVLTSARFYLAYRKFSEENRYDALAVSCWPKFQDRYRYSVCSVIGMLNGDGIPVACEGDLSSAVCMLLLKYLTNETTALMDLSAFDEKDDSLLFWHCGPAAPAFCRKNGYSLGVNYHGLPHEAGKEPNCCGVTHDMEFDPSPATFFRFSGDFSSYLELSGTFMGNGKKSFFGSRGWLGELRLNGAPICVKDFVNTVLVSGFEHHFPLVSGAYSEEIAECMAWLGVGSIDKIRYSNALQNGGIN